MRAPDLLDTIRALDPADRIRISAIAIQPGQGGYLAACSMLGMLPTTAGLDTPGIELRAYEAYPDILRTLDWRVDAWSQVLALIHDPEMSRPDNLGTMQAVQRGEGDSATWLITTHGLPASPERCSWLRSQGVLE